MIAFAVCLGIYFFNLICNSFEKFFVYNYFLDSPTEHVLYLYSENKNENKALKTIPNMLLNFRFLEVKVVQLFKNIKYLKYSYLFDIFISFYS